MIGPDPYSFRALWRQYRRCRRNKRSPRNALTFEVDAEARLLALQQELRDHTYRPGRSICFVRADVARLQPVLASYSGHLRHGQAAREWEYAWLGRPWLGALLDRQRWRVRPRWTPPRTVLAHRFQVQYRHLVRYAGGRRLVFSQVGRFVEFRGPQRALAARALGLRVVYCHARGTRSPRAFPCRFWRPTRGGPWRRGSRSSTCENVPRRGAAAARFAGRSKRWCRWPVRRPADCAARLAVP